MKSKLHLKWKVFLFLLGFCGLLLIILWVFQTVFLDSFYKTIKILEIKNHVNVIAQNIDNAELSELIDAVSQHSDMKVEILTASGEYFYTDAGTGDPNYDMLNFQVSMIEKARQNGGEYYEYSSGTKILPERRIGDPYNPYNFKGNIPDGKLQPYSSLLYIRLVESTKSGTLAVMINAIISPVNATVATLRYQLYVITGIMLILSVFLAIVIAFNVSKPIEDINRSAKQLAKGNYDTRFNGRGFLEIAELSDTLNTAAHELSKVESLRRELLANISHDLRTPLSLIYSYAELMHDFPDEITSEQTQIIMDEANRLSTLVNDVLDISKLESGGEKLKMERFSLTAEIKGVTDRMAELLKKDGYQIAFFSDGDITVCGDAIKITQAFYNLLINAVNYTGPEKRVDVNIGVSCENSYARVSVSDTGEGIAEEDLPYIWDRYYKADKKHKRAVTGTGLGLSIVKKIIGLHGGRYGVTSIPEKGSCFWFELKLEK